MTPEFTADWIRTSPMSYIMNTASIKSGQYVKALSAGVNAQQSCLMNVLGGDLDVQVAVPWDGSATVRTLSAGDFPRLIGAGGQNHMFDSQGVGVAAGTHVAFHGGCPAINHTADATLPALAAAYAKPIIQMGGGNNAVLDYKLSIPATTHWRHAGTLDATDGPAASYTSTQHNLTPRHNPADYLQHGMVVIHNTTTREVTATAKLRCVLALAVEMDDRWTEISAMAGALFHQAEHLQPVPPGKRDERPSLVAVPGQMKDAVKDAVPNVPKSILSRVLDVAHDVGAHVLQIGDLASMGSKLLGMFSGGGASSGGLRAGEGISRAFAGGVRTAGSMMEAAPSGIEGIAALGSFL
jgi:hypothetical protein